MEQPLLYHYILSFGSQLARLALTEKGVDWRGRSVDIGPAHQNYSPWFMNISPDGEVPLLVHDQEYIKGGFGIAKYINRRFVGPVLIPRNPQEESVCEKWVRAVEHFPVQLFSYAVAPGVLGLVARSSYRRSFALLKAGQDVPQDPVAVPGLLKGPDLVNRSDDVRCTAKAVY